MALRFLAVKPSASIARGHRKALVHLEAGDTGNAMRESTKAIGWVHRRFQGDDPERLAQYPHIANEIRAVRELAERSATLKEALANGNDRDIHEV